MTSLLLEPARQIVAFLRIYTKWSHFFESSTQNVRISSKYLPKCPYFRETSTQNARISLKHTPKMPVFPRNTTKMAAFPRASLPILFASCPVKGCHQLYLQFNNQANYVYIFLYSTMISARCINIHIQIQSIMKPYPRHSIRYIITVIYLRAKGTFPHKKMSLPTTHPLQNKHKVHRNIKKV